MNTKNSVSKIIFRALFANKCASCREITCDGALCKSCEQKLKLNEENVCKICGKPIERCVCKILGSRYYIKSISPLVFENKVTSALIYKLKSRGNKEVCNYLCTLMYRKINSEYKNISFDFVTEVPSTSKKKRRKGFDHAYLLAKELSRLSGIKYKRSPIKRINIGQQKTMDKEKRNDNANKSYILKRGGSIYGNVLLVDDVMTTGSTLKSCARLLKKAGAKKVYCITASTSKGYK